MHKHKHLSTHIKNINTSKYCFGIQKASNLQKISLHHAHLQITKDNRDICT